MVPETPEERDREPRTGSAAPPPSREGPSRAQVAAGAPADSASAGGSARRLTRGAGRGTGVASDRADLWVPLGPAATMRGQAELDRASPGAPAR